MKPLKPFKALIQTEQAPGYRQILVTEVRPTRSGRWRGAAYELVCSDNLTRNSVVLDTPKNRAGLRTKYQIKKNISKLYEQSDTVVLTSRDGFEVFTSGSASR